MTDATIVKIPFAGGEVQAFERDGKRFVVLRPIAEDLGVSYSEQLKKLKTKSWATVQFITTVAADGKNRRMAAVDVRTLIMWLATIEESKVSASVRPKLAEFQNHVADAIESYFTKGYAFNPNASQEQRESAGPAWEQWVSEKLNQHPALWTGRIVRELARLWKQPQKVYQAGGFPVGLIAPVRFVYRLMIGGDFYEALRELTGSGDEREKRYKALTQEGYALVARELGRVEMLARTCRTKEEFIDKMAHLYMGQPMQTVFW